MNRSSGRKRVRRHSPLRLLLTIALTIFAAETLLMLLFSTLEARQAWSVAVLDAALLVLLISPALYVFVFRPLVQEIAERRKIEEELKEHRNHLQALVDERTGELAATVDQLTDEIAHHKEAEEALEETKRYLSSLIESSAAAIIATNREGHVVLFNKGAENLLGYEREEAIGQRVTLLYETEEAAKDVMRRIREEGGSTSAFETVLQAKDGSLIPVLISASLLYDKEGQEAGTVGFNKDLRARKQAEEALRESEEKFRSITASAQDAIILIDDEGEVSYWNDSATKIFGYTDDEIAGKMLHEFIIPQRYRDLHIKSLKEFQLTGRGPVVGKRLELAALRKSGEEFPIELSLSSVKLQGTWHAIGIVRDLTESKRAEEQLRKLWVAVEQSASMVMITDTEGRIEYVNPHFSQVTGFSFQEAVGRNPRFLRSDRHPPEFYRELWETITAGEEWRGEFRNTKKDGEKYWEFATISPVRNTDGEITHFVGIKEDITERKKAEEALVKAHEGLREAYQQLELAQASAKAAEKLAALGRLTAGVTHEILNPLNAILLNLYILIHDRATPPTITEELKNIEEQARRITKISQDLLFFSRQRPPERRRIDLNEMVQRTLGLIEHELRMKGIAVELALFDQLPSILADQDQLQQVILNLLTNARDAMPGGGRLRLKTLVAKPLMVTEDKLVELRVEDTGPGIASEHIDKLFDPFFTTKPEGQGTGLGLSICQGIVENHGGYIWAENLSSGGAAFVIRLKAEFKGSR